MTDSKTKSIEAQSITRIMVRPYGSALPLGCFAFGFGNVLLSAFALHWIPASDTKILAFMLLGFAAPLEMIPCIMAFLSRDTGGATAMGVFSASWIVQGVQLLISGPASQSPAMGIFLLLLALFLAIVTVVTFAGKPLLGVLLVIALLRSLGASLVQLGFGSLESATAITGLLLSAFAFYAGLGFLLEDVKQRPLPMTFRQKDSKAALEGDLKFQLERLSTEAGVRKEL